MLKKTITGKYKEKKEIDKKKLLKVFTIFSICIISAVIIFFAFKYVNIQHKTVSDLYKEENYTKIVELYDTQSKLLTGTEEENLQIAKSLSNVQRYDESIDLYKKVLANYQMNSIQKTRILADYVEPLIKSGKTDEAFEVLDTAITWAEADIDLLKRLKRIYGFLVASTPTEDNLEKGMKHLYDYVNMDLDKKDWEANYYLSLLLYYAGDYSNAITYSVNCLKINRNADKAKHLIPKIYYEASDYEMAIEALKSLNKIEINNVDNYLLMGKCYEILRDWANVENTYNKVIQFDKYNEAAHMGLVRCYTLQHNTSALVNELYKIKDLDFSEENKEIIQVLLKQTVPSVVTSSKDLDFKNLQ